MQVKQDSADGMESVQSGETARVETRSEFPLYALGPLLGPAAESLKDHVQVPSGIAGQSVLAASALVVQGAWDVERGAIGQCPASLYFLTIAESGDRKSTVDRLALRPVREFEEKQRSAYSKAEAQFRAEMEIWEAKYQTVKRLLNGRKKLPDEDIEKAKAKLQHLEANKPVPPRRPNITIEEPTAEGIFRHLQEGLASAGLYSDEGVGFFKGHGMTNENRGRVIAMMSKLWDGAPLMRTRGAIDESDILIGRRLSAHLMVQPFVANEILKDRLLLEQGFLARFLTCSEQSIAGTRFLKGRDLEHGLEREPSVQRYWGVLRNLLESGQRITQDSDAVQIAIARLEGESMEAWRELHDDIEAEMAQGGRYLKIKPTASKAAENAARLAAIFAVIEGDQYPTVDQVKRAGWLLRYYLDSQVMLLHGLSRKVFEDKAFELLGLIKKQPDGLLEAGKLNKFKVPFRLRRDVEPFLEYLVDRGFLVSLGKNQNGKPTAWQVRETAVVEGCD